MLYIDTIVEDFPNRRWMVVCSNKDISLPFDLDELNDNKAQFFKSLEDNMTKIDEVGITGNAIQLLEDLDVFCMLISLFSMKVHLYLTNTNNMQIIDNLIKSGYVQTYTIIGE